MNHYEVRYSEEAKLDLADIYSYVANEFHEPKIAKEEISKKEFFDNYQIWRNVCHADSGIVYFVFLGTRQSLKTEVEEIKKKCKPIYQKKIRIKTIEEIVRDCLKIKDDERFHKHYEEFFEKYLKNI